MPTRVLLAVTCLVLVACGTGPATDAAPSSGGSQGTSSGPEGETLTSGSLVVTILSPLDGAEVNVPEVEVAGTAPAETTITANDEILVVDATGRFSVTLPLEPGLNLIEIVASDLAGNEVSAELTVVYETEPE
ncbi:MAG TPA: hypothetical protein VIG89_01065 [Candidatus Acidoferrales bacterium]